MPFDPNNVFLPHRKNTPYAIAAPAKAPRMDTIMGIKSRALHAHDRARNLSGLRAFFVPRICSVCAETRKSFHFLADADVVCAGCSNG